jgi:hypothetical protein
MTVEMWPSGAAGCSGGGGFSTGGGGGVGGCSGNGGGRGSIFVSFGFPFFFFEFLTNQTTCASVLSKRTTSQNYCQKRPALSGGTPGQAARGTCRLGQSRQGGAATPRAGMWLGRCAVDPAAYLPPPSSPARRLPAPRMAAPWCTDF